MKKNAVAKKILLSLGVLTGLTSFMGISGEAANLMMAVTTNYKDSQMGIITGSRVTDAIDSKSSEVKNGNFDNGDTAFFNIHMKGQSKLFMRQYQFGQTEDNAKPNAIFDTKEISGKVEATGVLKKTINAHSAAGYGDYVYSTGYDSGNIAIGEIVGVKIVDKNGISLKDNINSMLKKGQYNNKAKVRGEGLLVNGRDLYVQAAVNTDGGYMAYDNGFLLHYSINNDGSLSYKDKDYARIGKNTNQSRINLYNDHIFVSAIGGMQSYEKKGNAESTITAAFLQKGALTGSRSIAVPQNVQQKKQDFHDVKILSDGTAYVLAYNTGDGITGTLYQTTVSNLYSEKPENWTVIKTCRDKGWSGKIDAEENTHRLWIEEGNKLLVYTDGASNPTREWKAADFGNNKYQQYNSVTMIAPDKVVGATADLAEMKKNSLLGTRYQREINHNADIKESVDNNQITGTNQDQQYIGKTGDFSDYDFDANEVISVNQGKYQTGDVTTNVLAAVDAHKGNDVTVTAEDYTLGLQAEHTIGSPVGIYAGNGKSVDVTAEKLNVITKGLVGGNSRTNAIWLDAGKTGDNHITVQAGQTNIAMLGGYGGNGIAIMKTNRFGESSKEASGKNTITFSGNVNIKGTDTAHWGISLNPDNVYSRFNNAGILANVTNSEIEVKGQVDFDVYGNGITVNAPGSKVSVGGGIITVPTGMSYGYYTLGAYEGTINVNTGVNGNTPGQNRVQLNGDVFVRNGATANIALNGRDSYLQGIIDNGGSVNLWMKNGAIWQNEAHNRRYSDDNEDVGSYGASHINRLIGGHSETEAGRIIQKSEKDITIDRYEGKVRVDYGTMVQQGGGVVIHQAQRDSGIFLSGNTMDCSSGETLNALASKLTYTGYTEGERNLKGSVSVQEGLFTRSATYTGGISFDEKTGKGSLGEIGKALASPNPLGMFRAMSFMDITERADGSFSYRDGDGNEGEVGSTHTEIQKAIEAAMATTLLSMRSGMINMAGRLGDIHEGASDGLWGRVYTGKNSYNKNGVEVKNQFHGIQIGADRLTDDGWHIGMAMEYNRGNSSYTYGGEGEPKYFIGSFYGTKMSDDGEYFDVVARFGKTYSDFTVYNQDKKHVHGSSSVNGYGFSVEYGKRVERNNGSYIEPQLQLSITRIDDDNITANTSFKDFEKLRLLQRGFSSCVGRMGIMAGRKTEHGEWYVKADVLHEFSGDSKTAYNSFKASAIDIDADVYRAKNLDFKGTWAELSVGGTWKMNADSYLYADFSKGFGGEYKKDWMLNAGARFAF